ncbi:hypothetical protein [Streptomyces sp. Y7]|uniref:hypothetical protein n=1 Tax=Streptomyces sp. Y7 TaxID=3342392 RepID=UPI0037233320
MIPVDPQHLDWAPDVPCGRLLKPTGAITLITHRDCKRGRLMDPLGLLAHVDRSGSMVLLDRVVLVQVLLQGGADVVHDVFVFYGLAEAARVVPLPAATPLPGSAPTSISQCNPSGELDFGHDNRDARQRSAA